MSKVPRPTRKLLRGKLVTDGRLDGAKITGATWISNGHWAVRADYLSSPARPFEDTELVHNPGKIATLVRDILSVDAPHRYRKTTETVEVGVIGIQRYEKTPLFSVALVSDTGPKSWVDLMYLNWLAPGLEIFAGGELTPIHLKDDSGDTLALIMPRRA